MGAAQKKLDNAEMGSFFENMGMMLRAGISAQEAVGLLAEETGAEDGILSRTLTILDEKMRAGASMGDAMREAGTFPDYACDMTDSAEYTGRMENTLFHLSEYYRSENAMKKTLAAAVRYPLILLLMVAAVLLVMLKLVFPAFYDVYGKLTGSLSASSYRYIDVSFTVCRIMLIVIAVLAVVLAAGILLYRSGKQETVRKALSRIPAFARLFDNLDLYRFTSCFDMFIASGEMHEEAVKKSISVTETAKLRAKLANCVSRMDAGESFSQASFGEKLYDPVNNRMLIPAERSGMLDSVLRKILGNLKENNEENISRIANTIEPLLTGALMIFIGLLLISLMIPLIGIMNSIG